MASEDVPETEFSSDEDFDEDEDSDSSTDVDAKIAEDDIFDTEFLECYAALKKRDKKIYDTNVRFFNEDEKSDETNQVELAQKEGIRTNQSKAPKMTLLDHQLAMAEGKIVEPEVMESRIDSNEDAPKSFYEKELHDIKTSIKKQSEIIDSDSDDDLLIVKGSTAGEARAKPRKKIEDDVGVEIWNNPDQLSEEDKYLRDYIMNKRYLPSSKEEGNHFFSKDIDELSDVETDDAVAEKKKVHQVDPHSDIIRVPRNSTKTIRDLVEKQRKKEKRLKRVVKKKKKKAMLKDADCEDIIDDLHTKFHYREIKPQDHGLTAEEILMEPDEELEKIHTDTKMIKHKKKHKRGLKHKKIANTGVAPDRLLAYGLSKTKLKKSKLL